MIGDYMDTSPALEPYGHAGIQLPCPDSCPAADVPAEHRHYAGRAGVYFRVRPGSECGLCGQAWFVTSELTTGGVCSDCITRLPVVPARAMDADMSSHDFDPHLEPYDPLAALVTWVKRDHRLLNLVGMDRPWKCSLHHIDMPGGSDGCPACVAEWEEVHGRKLGEPELSRLSDVLRTDPDCTTCDGTGWVCENDGKPWGGLCCDFHNTGPGISGVCEHGACGCGAGDPCPSCNPDPPLSSGFATIIASVEDQ